MTLTAKITTKMVVRRKPTDIKIKRIAATMNPTTTLRYVFLTPAPNNNTKLIYTDENNL
jgi:hypothetical protein